MTLLKSLSFTVLLVLVFGNSIAFAAAPEVTIDQSCLTTTDSTPELFGTVNDPNSTVVVTVDGYQTGADINNGNWRVEGGSFDLLTVGEHSISVIATNTADEATEVDDTLTILASPLQIENLDMPDHIAAVNPAGFKITGNLNQPGMTLLQYLITDRNGHKIEGSTWPDETSGSFSIEAGADFSWDKLSALGDGPIDVALTPLFADTEEAGQIETRTIVKDTIAEGKVVKEFKNPTTDSTPSFTINAEAGSSIIILRDNTWIYFADTSDGTDQTFDMQPLDPGTFNFTLVVTDPYGNQNAYPFAPFELSSPTIKFDPAIVNTGQEFTASPIINADAGINSVWWEMVSGPGNVYFSAQDAVTPQIWADQDGQYVIRMKMLDGNYNEVSGEFTLNWNTSGLVISGVTGGEVVNHDLTIGFNQGIATLNGDPFSSGETVSVEGDYLLSVVDNEGNETTLAFTIDKTAPVISGVNDGDLTNQDVSPAFNEGTATLNGNEFLSGDTVSDEGNYTLIVTDLAGNTTTISFTIDKTAPNVDGVKDGDAINGEVTPTFNDGFALLNSLPFFSGTKVSEPGNYILIVTDAAGNVSTVNFTIEESSLVISGINNGDIVNRDVIIDFNQGTATLDNQPFLSGDTVSDEGIHTLVVTDNKGIKTTINFTIDKTPPAISGVNDGDVTKEDVTPTFNEGTATLNGDEFISGNSITEEGEYALIVTDSAGNETRVTFTIDKTPPIVSGVTDGQVSDHNLTITFNEGTAELNGNNFSSGHTITAEGNYTLVVVDLADNVTIVHFTIRKATPTLQITGVTNGEITNQNVTVHFNQGSATLNGDPFSSGQTVSAEGEYVLVVTDDNGVKTTINFTIDKTAPTVSGVTDKEITNSKVAINFSEGTATLNGNSFSSGDTVYGNGKYALVVSDEAGNVVTINFTIDTNLDLSDFLTGRTVTLEGEVLGSIFDENGSQILTFDIPKGTTITADGKWSGKIMLKKILDQIKMPFDGAVNIVGFDLGDTASSLSFNTPIEIVFKGQGGKHVGYFKGGVFHEITNACALNPNECKFNRNGDLVVKVNHFTDFVSFTRLITTSDTSAIPVATDPANSDDTAQLVSTSDTLPESGPNSMVYLQIFVLSLGALTLGKKMFKI